MTTHKRWWLLGLACTMWLCSGAVRAECGGLQDCIAISSDPAVAPRHSDDGVNRPAPTIDFGSQAAASASASRTILVAAVEGPAGTRATITSITISGANATDFALAGGTCTSGTPTLLHDGAHVAQIANSCTILVRFNPQAVGVKNAQVNVASAALAQPRVAPLTGTGTPSLAGPGAGAATMAVAVNTATTLDLAAFTTGVVTGIAIVTAPAHGSASVSGTQVTYTPATDYFGADNFTYAAFNAAGSSAAAPVTVDVGGRPDPSKDANVVGLIDAQQRTARRFASAQISNYQRRMESLHGSRPGAPRSRASAFETAPRLAYSSGMEHPGAAREPLSDAADASSTRLLGPVLAAAGGRIDLAAAGGRDLADRTGAGDEAGFWLSGDIGFGRRDPDGNARGLRFESDGITIGADRRFGERLALGIGAGFARDTTRIGTDGSENRTEGVSAALYGSFQPTPATFIDALLGYASLRHRSDRFVPAFGTFAQMRRKSEQFFGSIAGGYELRSGNVLLSPYARVDVVHDRFERAAESGAGAAALAFLEQSQTGVQGAVGLRAESRHETSFGHASPRLRVEVKHDFDDARNAPITYADLPAGPVFSVAVPGAGRTALLLGAGSEFELHNGVKLGVDYLTQRASGSDRSHTVRLFLRKELDGKALPAVIPGARLFDDPVRVEGGYTWDDNVTRAPDAAQELSDHIYSLAVTKSTAIALGTHTRLVFAGFVNAEKYYSYDGLDRVSPGVRGELQYRTSADFGAPTVGLFARSAYDEYSSSLRRGWRHAYGLSARQSWTDRIEAFAAYTRTARSASHEVFDGKDWSARGTVDYSLGPFGAIYLGGEYRRGDIAITSSPPGPGYGGYAKALVRDDAYADSTQLFAYRIEAKTVIWTLGYNVPLGSRDALDFSWRRAESTSRQPAIAAGTGLGSAGTPRYTANQYSLVYLMRF